ncbi:cadherin repeat domain-containing protein, partial [Gammaproteobacteria bacterium]|nr:cadherin repeat domain-containing protein [Gammaproteobacteria bacterium]
IDEEPEVDLNILSSSLSEDVATNITIGEVKVLDPEKNGISLSVSGEDSNKISVSESGQLILEQSLDYEEKKELKFVLDVHDGKNTVSTPIKINIENVHDISGSINLVNNTLHEGSSVESVIGSVNIVGDNKLSYSISGSNSDDFIVSSDGKIKVKNPLDYSSKNSYQLTLNVQGQNDAVSIPLNITIAENIAPDFTTNCKNSCSQSETVASGTVIIDSLRTDNDTDSISYALENDFSNQFSIDNKTGEVKLTAPLDFESSNSYNLKVIATDSKGVTKEISSSFVVNDVEVAPRTFNTRNTNLVGNKILKVEPSDEIGRFYLSDDISSKDQTKRVLFDLDQGTLPNGSTFSVAAEDASKYEVDSSGIVRIKEGVLNDYVSNKLTGQNLINYLAGAQGPIAKSDHEDFEDLANFVIDIPNEPNQNVELKIVPKKTESQENLVMKFASGYSGVNHSKNNPFKASATRGDGTSKNYNSSVQAQGGTITESTLSTSQLEGNSKVNSVIKKDDGSTAFYASSDGDKTFYRTNTVSNGINENDTDTLDFEYLFPINNKSGSSNTGTEKTKGQYAPLAVANADWDGEMHENEKAKYGCYDSGQGCGNGTHELALSGSMVQSTEDPFFTGYQVIQSNISENTDTLNNSDMNGANAGNGISGGSGSFNEIIGSGAVGGFAGFNLGQTNDENYQEFEIVTLPETFTYFGKNFTHVYVNENGFLTFGNGGNDADKPWHDLEFSGVDNQSSNSSPDFGGGRPLQYLDDPGSYGNDVVQYPDFLRYPDAYGKPGTSFEGNLNNSIFALWADYYNDSEDATCDSDGCNDFSIRQLWNAESKILTIGWYNMKTLASNEESAEANFEVQLNFNTDEFKIVHGKFGQHFPRNFHNNAFVGFSKDVTCSSSEGDISACEGKEYVQLYFHDSHSFSFNSPGDSNIASFQSTYDDGTANGGSPAFVNHMYNKYFQGNQTVNGTMYCFDSGSSANFFGSSANCSTNYSWNDAKGNSSTKSITRAVPQFSSDKVENVFLGSNIKQSYRVGLEAEFMWMHLNKPSTTLSYSPPESNASGFEQNGPNSNQNVLGGNLNSGDAVSTTTYADEIVIGGEVYKDSQLKSFLNDNKKVIAFAPIPVLHTNKYEMQQTSGSSDVRFKHVHTIMPQFISDEFMEDKNNGTDLRFDFHQLVDHDYSKSGNHLRYGTEGNVSFNLQNQFAATHGEADLDGLYAYASDVLDKKVSSKRFSGANSGEEYVIPEGQSLWQQVFNPDGRGAGIFVQMNWSCGSGGDGRCNEATSSRIDGPHKTQQSLLSVLIAEVGDKVFFEEGQIGQDRYTALNSGQVMQGEHFWSYKRRSGRTISSDGEFAVTDSSPQLTFGISPIACVSGKDNGCFFGDGQSFDSSTLGAPSTAIISTDDPCHSKFISGCLNDMDLGVMHSMAETTDETNPEYKVGTFYQGIVQQKQRDTNNNLVDAINLKGTDSWRSTQVATSDIWSGMMTGLFITDTNNTLNPHPQYLRANTVTTFDNKNDRVMVEQTSLNIYSNQSNQSNANDWYHSSGSFSGKDANLVNIFNKTGFKFGGADASITQPYYGANQWAPSAYLNKDVFGAMLEGQNVGKTDKGFLNNGNVSSDNNTDNAGALVTWNTIDEKDRDFMSDNSVEPELEYMTWGVWGMAMSDSQLDVPGYQASAVHMGTWFAGDLLDVSDWPVSRTATLAGIAMFDVFARIEDSGVTNSYQWTEGAGASGSIIFDGTGNYDIDISVANLGVENCPSSYCGSGFQPGTMSNGSPGMITWSASATAGQANFESTLANSSNGSTLISKQMWGELYGNSSHIEAGALLQYSLQSSNEMIMYSGTAILSE